MNLFLAETIIAAAKAAANAGGFAVSIAVLDAGAHLVAFSRMDSTILGAIDVAQRKARTAALFQTDSQQLGQVARPGGPIYSLEHTNGGLISFGGGVVLRDETGAFIGAVGISGATPEADEAIAQAAAAELLAPK